jgi:tRNA A37 threonylcarbamoyltransferase TsaD
MKPLQISAETAQKLAAFLKVPIEHLMHMPQHILLQKLAEFAAQETKTANPDSGDKPSDS